jgi:hypothetical protein
MPTGRGCVASRSRWTSAGTCCASDGRAGAEAPNPDDSQVRDEKTVEGYTA